MQREEAGHRIAQSEDSELHVWSWVNTGDMALNAYLSVHQASLIFELILDHLKS